MRVVAGSARGRRLEAPPGGDTRPTLDRVREALFNALGSLDAVTDARVLDLFAGSGALGIEALSRGARSCTFVERARPARVVLEANLDRTGLGDRAEVVAADAFAWLRGRIEELGASAPTPDSVAPAPSWFDLVLLDPPYATDAAAWELLLSGVETVAPGGLVVLESGHAVSLPPAWDVLREKRYGDTLVVITRHSSPPPEPS